jgi:hypothetical protein
MLTCLAEMLRIDRIAIRIALIALHCPKCHPFLWAFLQIVALHWSSLEEVFEAANRNLSCILPTVFFGICMLGC